MTLHITLEVVYYNFYICIFSQFWLETFKMRSVQNHSQHIEDKASIGDCFAYHDQSPILSVIYLWFPRAIVRDTRLPLVADFPR